MFLNIKIDVLHKIWMFFYQIIVNKFALIVIIMENDASGKSSVRENNHIIHNRFFFQMYGIFLCFCTHDLSIIINFSLTLRADHKSIWWSNWSLHVCNNNIDIKKPFCPWSRNYQRTLSSILTDISLLSNLCYCIYSHCLIC